MTESTNENDMTSNGVVDAVRDMLNEAEWGMNYGNACKLVEHFATEAIRRDRVKRDTVLREMRDAAYAAIAHMENNEETDSFDNKLYMRVCAAAGSLEAALEGEKK